MTELPTSRLIPHPFPRIDLPRGGIVEETGTFFQSTSPQSLEDVAVRIDPRAKSLAVIPCPFPAVDIPVTILILTLTTNREEWLTLYFQFSVFSVFTTLPFEIIVPFTLVSGAIGVVIDSLTYHLTFIPIADVGPLEILAFLHP